MRPKNKFQESILTLSKSLKQLDEKRLQYGYNKCFSKIGVVLKKGILTCLECSHKNVIELNHPRKMKCSNCNVLLEIKKTKQSTYESRSLYTVIDKYKNHQVFRTFLLYKKTNKSTPCTHSHRELYRFWFSPNGDTAVTGLVCTNKYLDTWGGEFEIRDYKTSSTDYLDCSSIVYPYSNIIPYFKQKGVKPRLLNEFVPTRLFKLLTECSQIETLVKQNQIGILKNMKPKEILEYWKTIKIVLKNNYDIKEADIWFDYIKMLKYLKKDLLSPKFIMPKNLEEEHDKLMRKTTIKKEREAEENRKQQHIEKLLKEEKNKEQYIIDKQKFFPLVIQKDDLIITPLKSIEEFCSEGRNLNHCVFLSEYYLKQDSLILKAEIDEVSVETIEVDLTTMEIRQSRGKSNRPSIHHDRIIKLVNRNMNVIKRYSVA